MKKLIIILIALVFFGCNNRIPEQKHKTKYVFLDCSETDTSTNQEAVVFASLDSICWTSIDTVIIENTADIINNAGYKWYRIKFMPSNTNTLKTHVHYFVSDSILTREGTVKNINTTENK